MAMPVKVRTFKNKMLDACFIIAGTLILAMSVEMFVIPYNILSGGVAGIAVAAEPFFHIDKTLLANALTLILFFVGWAVLGKEFAINTAFSSLLYPCFTTLLSWVDFNITVPPMLASFYAGLLGGVGIGLIMRAGASSGGMDVPPLILHKITGAKISTLVVITDGLTVLIGILAYDLNAALIGLISVFASGAGIRYTLEAGQGSSAKSVQIISDSYQEITETINKELDRGVTLLDAEGGYSSDPKKVILCVVSGRQYTRLLGIIREIDDRAFVITTDASDMHGEGFTYSSPNI
ncbi:MAG: YitT family protein [Solobacterium sp.]|jgi:uncharacterized membrane-anchored protein YitT (DUF2179 family)|nr:YitT family protein [Solobacterium sp.]MCH4226957.1 YitT family protein [Solobacterium sp.]MCH4282251.1 YitT family protein [Solobacterium sp.]